MRLLHVAGLDEVSEYPIRLQRQLSSRAYDDARCPVPVGPFYLVEKLHGMGRNRRERPKHVLTTY